MIASMRVLAMKLLMVAAALPTTSTTTPEQRRERLQAMSSAEKDELRLKQERFEKMPREEQEKLRRLERMLQTDPQGEELRKVMLRYHEWLRALPSSERAEILRAAPDQRVEQIKIRLAQEKEQRQKELAFQSVNQQDLETISRWMKTMFKRAEPELLAKLPPQQRADFLKTEDEGRRFGVVVSAAIKREGLEYDDFRYEKIMRITENDRQDLVNRLSPMARDAYYRAENELEQRRLVQNWVRLVVLREIGRSPPEDVRRFLERADPKLRDQLDYMPPHQMRAQMERYFRFEPWRRFPGDRGGFKGGPGPGRPFPNRPSGQQEQ